MISVSILTKSHLSAISITVVALKLDSIFILKFAWNSLLFGRCQTDSFVVDRVPDLICYSAANFTVWAGLAPSKASKI